MDHFYAYLHTATSGVMPLPGIAPVAMWFNLWSYRYWNWDATI